MRIVFLGLGILSVSFYCRAQTAQEIINKYIDTVSSGDIDNWRRIGSICLESEGTYSQHEFEQARPSFSPPQTHYMKTYKLLPDKEKIELYADSAHTVFLSSTLWLPHHLVLEFNNLPRIVKPADKDRDIPSYFMPLAIHDLLEESRSITFNGIRHFPNDGIYCFEIEVRTKDTSIGLYFNVETYLLEYRNEMSDVASGAPLLAYTRYTDYAQINGLLFYMTYYSVKDGRIFHAYRTKQISIDCYIDKNKFKF